MKKVAKVKAKLKQAGTTVWYHYAWRGGSRFWIGAKDDDENTPGYREAYKAATECTVQARPPTVKVMAEEWKGSMEWEKLAARTKDDYALGLADFLKEFGEVEAARLFGDLALPGLVLAWIERKGWRGKNADKRLDAAKGLASWLHARHGHTYPKSLLLGIPKFYRYRPRAEMVWTKAETDKFITEAAPRLAIAVTFLRDVGPRIGDAVLLGPEHAHRRTDGGYAIIWTPGKTRNSTGAVANVVATPAVVAVVEATPEGQKTFLVDSRGRPWNERTLAKEIALEAKRLKIKHAGRPLTVNDLRGTMAAELAWDGASVKAMALRMGWTEETAAKMMRIFTSRNPDAIVE